MGTQPENTHGIQTQTQPNPYQKFGSGLGITLGYPNFGYPIPTLQGRLENSVSLGQLALLLFPYTLISLHFTFPIL